MKGARTAFREGGVPLGEVVTLLLKAWGLDEQLWVNGLAREWPRLVGEAVAAHSRPGRMEKGWLTVFVDNAVWLNELRRYGQKDLLANLQREFGTERIRGLRLQPDPGGRVSSGRT